MSLWLAELAVFAIPAATIGATIGWVTGRWYPCLLLGYAAAIAFCNSHYVTQHLHNPLSLTRLLCYAAMMVMPPILVAAFAGYLIADKIKKRTRGITRASF